MLDKKFFVVIVVILSVLVLSIYLLGTDSRLLDETNLNKFMRIETKVFENGRMIPSKYTCDGEDIIPQMTFSEVPSEAKSLVIIIDDPDAPIAGGWDHFIVWNISPDIGGITEGIEPEGVKGKNSWGTLGYRGPCPPNEHKYYFKVFALDTMIELPEGSTKDDLMRSIDGHVLDKAEIWGKYSRIK